MRNKKRFKGNSSSAIGIVTIVLSLLVFAGAFFYKFSAPQSRTRSRFGGEPVVAKFPEDFKRENFVGVSFDNGVKNLIYWLPDGRLKAQEYTDFGLLQGVIIWEE